MNIEEIRIYCLSRTGATEDLPFDEYTLVIRVMNKIFAILPLDTPDRINLKCDPEMAASLREHYDAVKPGYHMNKKHWNTISLSGDAPSDKIREWIDHSYQQVVNSLTRKQREELNHLPHNNLNESF